MDEGTDEQSEQSCVRFSHRSIAFMADYVPSFQPSFTLSLSIGSDERKGRADSGAVAEFIFTAHTEPAE